MLLTSCFASDSAVDVVNFADFYSLWNMSNVSVVSVLFLTPLCLKRTAVSSSSDSAVQSSCVLLPSPLAAEDDDVPRRLDF